MANTAFGHDATLTTPGSTTDTALVRWANTSGTSLNNTINILSDGSNITLNARGEVRFSDADSSHYIAFESPATVGTSYTMTLPADLPAADEVLTVTSYSGGAGVLEWAAAGGDLSFGGDTFGENKVIGANDAYSLSLETSGSTRITVAAGGQVTMPAQPAFCAYVTATATDVTGQAGTAYIMGAAGTAGGGMTEDFDRGGNFSTSTFKFVAPVAGIYFFHAQAELRGIPSSGHAIAPSVWIYKGNTGMVQGGTVDTAGDMVSSGRVRVSLMLELAVDDEITARVTATNASGGNVLDVAGGSAPRRSFFMGYLVA